MITVQQVSDFLNTVAPFNTQCRWDNSGMLIGDRSRAVTTAAFALDLTMETLEQAKACGAELLITHHPVIFNAKKTLLSHDPVYALCQSGLAAVSVHTPWDCAADGVNDVLCKRLGLQNVQGIPTAEAPLPMARIGDIAPCSPEAFAKLVASALHTTVQLVPGTDTIRRVAVCGGSAMDFFFDAVALGADAYLTGEAKHHERLWAADCGKTLVVGDHFATEAPSMEALRHKVQQAFPTLKTVLLRQPFPVKFVGEEG